MNWQKFISIFFAAVSIVFTLSSCQAIEGIFKAGVWTGIIIVVGIIGLIVYFIGRGKK